MIFLIDGLITTKERIDMENWSRFAPSRRDGSPVQGTVLPGGVGNPLGRAVRERSSFALRSLSQIVPWDEAVEIHVSKEAAARGFYVGFAFGGPNMSTWWGTCRDVFYQDAFTLTLPPYKVRLFILSTLMEEVAFECAGTRMKMSRDNCISAPFLFESRKRLQAPRWKVFGRGVPVSFHGVTVPGEEEYRSCRVSHPRLYAYLQSTWLRNASAFIPIRVRRDLLEAGCRVGYLLGEGEGAVGFITDGVVSLDYIVENLPGEQSKDSGVIRFAIAVGNSRVERVFLIGPDNIEIEQGSLVRDKSIERRNWWLEHRMPSLSGYAERECAI